MNTGVKALLYAVLVIATAVTGYFFFQNFGKLFGEDNPRAAATAAAASTEPEQNAAVPPVDTNTVPDTNAVSAAATPAAADTNAIPATNTVVEAASTNAAPETNAVAAAAAPPDKKAKKGKANSAAPGTGGQEPSRIGMWTGLFVLCVIALGALIAWDVSNYMGNKSLKLLYNDEGEGMKDPEYEQAEQVWADGQPLEAIRMMRDYLNKNPRELHVALRIAEIYEKDLSNFLAAALEYEDVLKKKLPAERWGWAAIHLCNLYFKIGQEGKSYVLLQRIVKEYGETQAAEKARKRLSEVDPALLAEAEPPEPQPEAEPEQPKSNLPPGFRPKK